MSARTGIEWTDATWNPIRGCTRVSEGCRNCYAETVAARFSGPGQPYEGLARMTAGGPRWTGAVYEVEKHLYDPLRWTKPRRVFVNSMSDLFHERVSDQYIARVFAVMALAPQHTFQVLTKRPERMHALLTSPTFYKAVLSAADQPRRVWPKLALIGISDPAIFPLGNVWLGVSVEHQEAANGRIPLLLDTPAAVRFLSCEPLLGPVTFRWAKWQPFAPRPGITNHLDGLRRLDWIIVGGESGRGARPMHPGWARTLRDECVEAGVPFFFKQWGDLAPWVDEEKFTHCGEESPSKALPYVSADGTKKGVCWIVDDDWTWSNYAGDDPDDSIHIFTRTGKKAAGRELDGRTWDEMPERTS